MKKLLHGLLLFSLLLVVGEAYSQTPSFMTQPATAAGVNNVIPYYNTANGTRAQAFYPPSVFTAITAPRFITAVYMVPSGTGNWLYSNIEISLGQPSITSLTSGAYATGMKRVFTRTNYTVTRVQDAWYKFELDSQFYFDPSLPLVVEINVNHGAGNTGSLTTQYNDPHINGTQRNYSTAYNAASPGTTGSTTVNKLGLDLRSVGNNNAMMKGVLAPVNFCNPSQDIKVRISNGGSNRLNNVNVQWTVDGIPQAGLTFASVLDTMGGTQYPQDTVLTIGNVLFGAAAKVIRAWVEYPNSAADTINRDDTAQVTLKMGLNGTYTIGGTSPDYATFAGAVNDLNSYGVCGPVTFKVAAGTYAERITINQVTGASATNTIHFNGAGKGTTTLTYAATATTGDMGTVLLNGTDHIHFRDMTVAGTHATYAAGFILTNNADSNSFRNMSITMNNASTGANVVGIAVTGVVTDLLAAGNAGSYNIFDSLEISGGTYGISVYGPSTTSHSQANHITNCMLTSQYSAGLRTYSHSNYMFRNNHISGGRSATYYGIYAYYGANYRIENNAISSPDIGIQLGNANSSGYNSAVTTLIANNMVSAVTDDGIYAINCDHFSVLHNTVLTSGTGTAIGAAYFTASEFIDCRNNIFGNASGTAVYFPATALFTNLDHNNYYTGGATLANVGASTYVNLNLWKVADPVSNKNAVSQTAVFVSATNLHLHKSSPVFRVPNINLNTDIDGEVRYTPTIAGADEPTRGYHDAGLEMVNFFSCAGTQPIKVNLLNDGKNIISSVGINWQVNGIPQNPFSWNHQVDTLGSPTGPDTVITIGNYSFSGTTYDTIKVWTTSPNNLSDTLNYNDTISFITKPGLVNTYTVGSGGNYANLTAAFNALGNGLCGPVTLELLNNYTSTGETLPLVIPQVTSAANTLTIRPQSGVSTPLSISGNHATAIIDLNGTKYIIIDGRPGGTGASLLTITNTATNAPVIRFINDATNNTLQYTNITGNNATLTSGALVFSTSLPGVSGNSNNLIDRCNINGNRATANCIYSSGSATPADNKANTITNSNIFDFFTNSTATTAAANGIVLDAGNSSWNIGTAGNGNNFYQTGVRNATSTPALTNPVGFRAVYINHATVNGCSIVGNRIGGNIPGVPSSVFTIGDGVGTIALLHYIRAIDINLAGTTVPTSIQGNTISDMTVYSGITGAPFAGIHVLSGLVNTGNIIGNTIGAATGTGSVRIYYKNASTGVNTYGIRYSGGSSGLIQNNTIGSVTGEAVTGGLQLLCIYINGSLGTATTVSNNLIGSLTTAHSIQSPATSGNVNVMGICASGATASLLTISNNTISNLSNLNASAGTNNAVKGIYNTGAATGGSVIANNVVRALYSVSANPAVDQNGAVIAITSNNSSGNHSISGNRVYGLYSNAASGAANVTGIHISGATSGGVTISRNNISGITAGTNALILLSGINVGLTATTRAGILNNMISLGYDSSGNAHTTAHTLTGILKAGAASVLYNSVNISGSGVGTTVNNTYAYRATANVAGDSMYNNLFVNTRANTTSGGNHFAIGLANAVNLSVNYNNYSASGAIGLFNGIVQNNIGDWRTSTTQDARSVSAAVNFVSPTDLHLSTGSIGNPLLTGTPLAAVSVDYDNASRSATYPYMGADENVIPVPVKLSSFTATIINSDVLVQWTTASEKNASHFMIEASENGKDFLAIGRTEAKGNSSVSHAYSFMHQNAWAEMNMAKTISYRLTSVDKDGSAERSEVVVVNFTDRNDPEPAKVYPNPFTKNLTVNLASETAVIVTVSDIQGRIIFEGTKTPGNGSHEIVLKELSHVEKGIYFIRINNEQGSHTIKVVKE